jgi:hypothetical protein
MVTDFNEHTHSTTRAFFPNGTGTMAEVMKAFVEIVVEQHKKHRNPGYHCGGAKSFYQLDMLEEGGLTWGPEWLLEVAEIASSLLRPSPTRYTPSQLAIVNDRLREVNRVKSLTARGSRVLAKAGTQPTHVYRASLLADMDRVREQRERDRPREQVQLQSRQQKEPPQRDGAAASTLQTQLQQQEQQQPADDGQQQKRKHRGRLPGFLGGPKEILVVHPYLAESADLPDGESYPYVLAEVQSKTSSRVLCQLFTTQRPGRVYKRQSRVKVSPNAVICSLREYQDGFEWDEDCDCFEIPEQLWGEIEREITAALEPGVDEDTDDEGLVEGGVGAGELREEEEPEEAKLEGDVGIRRSERARKTKKPTEAPGAWVS